MLLRDEGLAYKIVRAAAVGPTSSIKTKIKLNQNFSKFSGISKNIDFVYLNFIMFKIIV